MHGGKIGDVDEFWSPIGKNGHGNGNFGFVFGSKIVEGVLVHKDLSGFAFQLVFIGTRFIEGAWGWFFFAG